MKQFRYYRDLGPCCPVCGGHVKLGFETVPGDNTGRLVFGHCQADGACPSYAFGHFGNGISDDDACHHAAELLKTARPAPERVALAMVRLAFPEAWPATATWETDPETGDDGHFEIDVKLDPAKGDPHRRIEAYTAAWLGATDGACSRMVRLSVNVLEPEPEPEPPGFDRLAYPTKTPYLLKGDTLVVVSGRKFRKVGPDRWWLDRSTPPGEPADVLERRPRGGIRQVDRRDIVAVERPRKAADKT